MDEVTKESIEQLKLTIEELNKKLIIEKNKSAAADSRITRLQEAVSTYQDVLQVILDKALDK